MGVLPFLFLGGWGTGDAPAGAPKGFPLALWKPSGGFLPWQGAFFVLLGARLAGVRGRGGVRPLGRSRGFPLAPAPFGVAM